MIADSKQEEKNDGVCNTWKNRSESIQNGTWRHPDQRIDAEGTRILLHKLADQGVNYIDTARGYTVSEEYLGYALEGIRDKFILATKSMARTREAMAADIEKSLHNLRTDHIDLYQVHNPNMEQLDQVLAAGRSS